MFLKALNKACRSMDLGWVVSASVKVIFIASFPHFFFFRDDAAELMMTLQTAMTRIHP
jgi:hypothetical protein